MGRIEQQADLQSVYSLTEQTMVGIAGDGSGGSVGGDPV